MAAQAQGSCDRRQALIAALWIFAAAVAIAAWVVLGIFMSNKFPAEAPKYSVAVAAVAGLDPALDLSARGRPMLSPVFNVTVHIDNTRNAFHRTCVPDLLAAEVSYGDAFLGRGTLPKICAGTRRQAEGVVRAWGQDLVVPWFLRDQLAGELAAGEAEVDVHLMRPHRSSLLVCKAKIGGGLSRCREPESAW
ncbi:unnamed protein product [Urochloa decumbens]|uniref:Late embryogenesis abundant protein LEA-2 subgroup domain-containing protein n=1 Tax=Urochloa decumbens TaxID=240449 RepID=A0ABC9F4E0_9POAL